MDHAHQQYTCPMHPEVIKDAPGKCPKCGMDLVPVKEANAEHEHGHGHEGHSGASPKDAHSPEKHEHSHHGGHAHHAGMIIG